MLSKSKDTNYTKAKKGILSYLNIPILLPKGTGILRKYVRICLYIIPEDIIMLGSYKK